MDPAVTYKPGLRATRFLLLPELISQEETPPGLPPHTPSLWNGGACSHDETAVQGRPITSLLLLLLLVSLLLLYESQHGKSQDTKRATWVRETVGCRRTDGRHSGSVAARSLDDRVASDEKQSSFPALCLARLPTFPVRATPFLGSFPCAIPAPSPSAPRSDGSVRVPLSASL